MARTIQSSTHLATFISLPREQLLFVKRKHWFTLLVPIVFAALLSFFLFFLLLLFSAMISFSLSFFLISCFTIITITISLITKIIVDWYFHLYAITTQKLLEISYTPLFSRVTNDVLLDQVRCTEIDVKVDGMLNQLIDMGTIIVTFDRPTHQEEFILEKIKDSQQVSMLIGKAMSQNRNEQTNEYVWYKTKNIS